MLIGLDVDEVLLNLTPSILPHINALFGKNFTIGQIHNHHMELVFGVPDIEMKKAINDIFEGPLHDAIPPVRYALEAIQEMATEHQFEVVTSRPHRYAQITQDLLERHYGRSLFRGYHFVDQRSPDHSKHSKAAICLANGLDVIIEDHTGFAIPCYEAGITTLLINRPWNMNVDVPEGIFRFNEWNEVPTIIKELARNQR